MKRKPLTAVPDGELAPAAKRSRAGLGLSETAKKLVAKLGLHHVQPVSIHVVPFQWFSQLKEPWMRSSLTRRVQHHGGLVLESLTHAQCKGLIDANFFEVAVCYVSCICHRLSTNGCTLSVLTDDVLCVQKVA